MNFAGAHCSLKGVVRLYPNAHWPEQITKLHACLLRFESPGIAIPVLGHRLVIS